MIRHFIGVTLLAAALVTPGYAQSGNRLPSGVLTPAVRSSFDIPFSIFARDRRNDNVILRPHGAVSLPVFIGIIQDQSGFTGFIKFPSRDGSPDIITVRPGDMIPGYSGRIDAISPDSLVLSMEGRSQQVISVGQVMPVGPRIIESYGY